MNNNFKIFIDNVEYTQFISYPLEFVEKNLNESYNNYTITLNRTNIAAPFVPNQKVLVEWYDGGTLYKSLYTILISDAVEKIGRTSFFKHNLSLIDYAYYLELIALPDITVTRLEGVFTPTLKEVAERVLRIASFEVFNNNTQINITLSSDAAALLDEIESPEWTFIRMTAFEALRMIFNFVKVTPVMVSFTELGFIGASIDFADTTDIGKFGELTEAYDPRSYRTRLVSSVSNFIAGDEEDGAITEPGNGFLTPRSPDGFEISNDNAIIPTSRPIYKIEPSTTIVMRYLAVSAFIQNTNNRRTVTVPEDLIPQHFFRFDVETKDILYEESVYNTLDNLAEYGERGGAFFYKQGEKNIQGLTSRAPSKFSWFPNTQAFRVVYQHIGNQMVSTSFTTENAGRFIKNEFAAQAQQIAIDYWVSQFGTMDTGLQAEPNTVFGVSYIPHPPGHANQNIFNFVNTLNGISNTNHNEISSRITYVPFTQTNLYTYRERKTNNDELITTQNYNQQANVVSSSVFAELHDRVSKSNSGSNRNLMYIHANLNEVLPVGKRFGEYIIEQASNQIFPQSIISHYEFDQFFLKLNTYVAVLEKWRQFAIPSENIVTRQITLNRFAKFSFTAAADTAGVNEALYLGDKEIQILRVARPGVTGVYLPITNFAFNNSLVWEGFFDDNVSAGPKSEALDANKRVDKPHIYTNADGRFNSTISLRFATQFNNSTTLAQSFNFPISPAVTNNDNMFFNQSTSTIDKDAREALAFSLQLHHIDTTGVVYINDGFAKTNGLIGGPGINPPGRAIVFLNKAIHDKKFIDASDIVQVISGPSWNLVGTSLTLQQVSNNNQTPVKAWSYAVLDAATNKYRPLIWVDQAVPATQITNQLFINFSDEY